MTIGRNMEQIIVGKTVDWETCHYHSHGGREHACLDAIGAIMIRCLLEVGWWWKINCPLCTR